MLTVLPVATRALLDACEVLGFPAAQVLARAGLEPQLLADVDGRIPAAHASAVWAAIESLAVDPCLGIRAAEALPFGAYRSIDYLVAHAPTIGDGLERIAGYFPLIDPRARVDVTRGPDATHVLVFASELGPIPRRSVEYTFTALICRSRVITRRPWRPRWVEIEGPREHPQHDMLVQVWCADLRYDAPRNALALAPEDWSAANVDADRSLFELLDQHVRAQLDRLPSGRDPSASKLRAVISELLPRGEVSLELAARRMGMSGRTLQRRLDEHGRSFGDVVDEVRAEHAKALLARNELALAEVAFLLGFSDQSAFGRAFKRWTGHTPGRWRAGV
jgi:AraC-like DNA-binding protein